MVKLKYTIFSVFIFSFVSSAYGMNCYLEIDNEHIPPRCICKLNNTVPDNSRDFSYFENTWLPSITFFAVGLCVNTIWKNCIEPRCTPRCKKLFCCSNDVPKDNEDHGPKYNEELGTIHRKGLGIVDGLLEDYKNEHSKLIDKESI